MTKCIVCEGDDFDLHDGLYYCSTCQTQSQELLEEEHVDDFSASVASSSTSSRFKITTNKRKKFKSTKNFGKSWTTYDGYNLILKKQVDDLISLGASPFLKPVVLSLWTRYLEKIGVASLKGRAYEREKPFLKTYPRLRDIETMYDQRAELVMKERRRSNFGGYKRNKRQRKKKIIKSKKIRAFESSTENESSDGDNTSDYGYLSESSMTSDSDTASCSGTSNDSVSSVHISKAISKAASTMKNFNRCVFARSVQRMNLSQTLAFLYLGLLLLNEQILLSDIIRWVWENRIPLYNTVDCFPNDLKFQLFDNQTFRMQHAVSAERVRSDTGHLAKFLDIQKIPNKPLHYIAARFIKQLNLPVSMCSMVTKLISSYPSNVSWSAESKWNIAIPDYEGKAAAYVIVALKLLFGFNGLTEWKISEYSRIITENQLFDDKPPFNFCEWRKQAGIKWELLLCNWQRNIRRKFTNRSTDVEELLQFYCQTGYKWRGKLSIRRPEEKNCKKREEIYDLLCHIFKKLELTVSATAKENLASSFPLHSESNTVFDNCLKLCHSQYTNGRRVFDPRSSNSSRESLNFLLPKKKAITNNSTKNKVKGLRKSYSKSLKSYKKYMVLNACPKKAKSSLYSFGTDNNPFRNPTAWLLQIACSVLEMKRESLYQEVCLIENFALKLKRRMQKK